MSWTSFPKVGIASGASMYVRRGLPECTRTALEVAPVTEVNFATAETVNPRNLADLDLVLARTAGVDLSVHMPSDFYYPSADARKVLPQIVGFATRHKAKYLVVHPDLVQQPAWLGANIGDHILAIENMDRSKNTGQTPEDLKSLFEVLPQARLLLDVNHVNDVDPEGESTLLLRFLTDFATLIAGGHVSALNKDNGMPHGLYLTNKHPELSALRMLKGKVPRVILEGVVLPGQVYGRDPDSEESDAATKPAGKDQALMKLLANELKLVRNALRRPSLKNGGFSN